MEFRTIRREEAADHSRLMQYAFGTYKTEEIKKDAIDAKPIDQITAAFDEAKVASCMTIHDFEQSVRGTPKRMAGIGGVATLPQYRGRGLARELLCRGFERMHEAGQSVSMLRPFRERFYEKFGYVRSNGAIDYAISCRSFAQFAGNQRSVSVHEVNDHATRDHYFTALRECFCHVHGRILFEALSDRRFADRFENRLLILAERNGQVEAMATYSKEGFMTEGRLQVADFFWKSADAREQVFAYLALHRDQIAEITLTLPYDTNIHAMVPAIENRVAATYRGAPWMVRIIDAVGAFDGIPCHENLDVVLAFTDPICDWNNCSVRLATECGQITATRTEKPADIELTVSAASALLYGTLPPQLLIREHQPTISRASAWQTLMAALPQRTLFNDYWF